MIFCILLMILVNHVFTSNLDELDDGVMKFTKVLCSTSGKSGKNLSCHVRPRSRSVGHMNIELVLIRTLKNIFVDIIVFHKPLIGGNFVQIVKFDKLNGCDLIKTARDNILYRYFLEFSNGTFFKGVIRDCPYPVGNYKVENATMDVSVIKKWDSFQRFPNGEQKYDVRLYNKVDENVLTLKIFSYVKIRANTLNSFDKM